MITNKLKSTIKATPLLYSACLPLANFVRLLKQPKSVRQMKRFRQYCMDLSKFVADPMFVKMGAKDGITSDPCSVILLADRSWKGLLIEPVPYCFDRLKIN